MYHDLSFSTIHWWTWTSRRIRSSAKQYRKGCSLPHPHVVIVTKKEAVLPTSSSWPLIWWDSSPSHQRKEQQKASCVNCRPAATQLLSFSDAKSATSPCPDSFVCICYCPQYFTNGKLSIKLIMVYMWMYSCVCKVYVIKIQNQNNL